MSVSQLRRAAELLLGPWIIRRHLPSSMGGGLIFVSGRVGGLKYLLKSSRRWDPELLTIAKLLVSRGDRVWDVGANVGLFSKAAASRAGAEGSVLSIEADLDAVALLNRTSRHCVRGDAAMTVLPVAVSDSSGFIQFAIAQRARAPNAIAGFGSTQTGGVREIRTLPCVTLDSLLGHFLPPAVLKIDVEGAELGVLGGAQQLLGQARPLIYCEVSARTRVEVAKLLESHAYRLWDGCRFNGTLNDPGVSAATSNVVAIPEDRIEGFLGRNG